MFIGGQERRREELQPDVSEIQIVENANRTMQWAVLLQITFPLFVTYLLSIQIYWLIYYSQRQIINKYIKSLGVYST